MRSSPTRTGWSSSPARTARRWRPTGSAGRSGRTRRGRPSRGASSAWTATASGRSLSASVSPMSRRIPAGASHGRRAGNRMSIGPAGLTVAVLGLGEAGSEIAQGLAGAGARVRGFDPAVPALPGVEAASGDAEACRAADLVLSLTTAGEAEGALRQALGGLSATAVYADANTAAARLKQRLAGVALQEGVSFADVA